MFFPLSLIDGGKMKRRDLLKRELIITILFAFVLQTIGILLNIQNTQLGLVDFYVLSIPNSVLLNGVLVWTMPIYVGVNFKELFYSIKMILIIMICFKTNALL